MNRAPSRRADLPPLPPSVRARVLDTPHLLDPWSGASGPFWRRPRGVVQPSRAGDLPEVMGWARRHGLSLIPRGGGTGMPGGNVGPGVILDLTRLDTLHETAVESGGEVASLRAGAGVTGVRLRDGARAAGWDLPALPSSARWCTVGGMIACNAAGARSLRYGPVRTWVRSLEWVRADGRVERLARHGTAAPEWAALTRTLRRSLSTPLPWPRVRKNSSGYALDAFLPSGNPLDLAVGSEGTLGVVTGATFVLSPPPTSRAVVLLGVPALSDLPAMSRAAGDLRAVTACEYFGRRLVELGGLDHRPELQHLPMGAGLLLVELSGDPDQVAGARGEVEGMLGGGFVTAADPEGMDALWELRHAANPILGGAMASGRRSTQFIEDSVVPVEELGRYVAELTEILARHSTDAVLFGHAGDGNLHVNPLVDLGDPGWRERVEALLLDTVDLVARLGGTLAGEHGDGRLRTPFLPRIFAPEVTAAFRTVKETLDPLGLLNPGVKVPSGPPEPLAGLGDAPGFASGSQGPERAP